MDTWTTGTLSGPIAMCRSGQCTARAVAWNRTLAVQRHTKYMPATRGQKTTELSQSLWEDVTSHPLKTEHQIPSGPFLWSSSTQRTALTFLYPDRGEPSSISILSNRNAKQKTSVFSSSRLERCPFLRILKLTLSCRCLLPLTLARLMLIVDGVPRDPSWTTKVNIRPWASRSFALNVCID